MTYMYGSLWSITDEGDPPEDPVAYVHLWGIDPSGKPRAYIGHIPLHEVDEWKAKAEAEGWTDIRTGKVDKEEPAEEPE